MSNTRKILLKLFGAVDAHQLAQPRHRYTVLNVSKKAYNRVFSFYDEISVIRPKIQVIGLWAEV